MGTRRGSGNAGIIRFPARGKKHQNALKASLDKNREARVIVNAAVGFAAASNPTVASVVTAYRVGKACWKTAEAYDKTYERTHNHDQAVSAAKKAVVKETKKEIRGELVGAIVDGSLSPSDSSAAAGFARELAKSVANECIGEIEKDARRPRK